MNEHYTTKINLIKIFMLFQIFSHTISLSCNDYSFCFECISDNLCLWGSNSCLNSTEYIENEPFGNPTKSPKKCFEENDDKTKNYIAKYCGDIFYNFRDKDKSILISLPKNENSLYGRNKLYCEYTINNRDSIESITIHTKKNWGSLKVKYIFEDTYYEIILGNGDQNILMDVDELKIIFESNLVKNTIPFEIEIVNTFSKINKIIIIVTSISAFVIFVIIVIIIIVYCKRRRKISINNNINNLNNIYINNVNIINDISTDRIGLTNYLNIIKPIKFNEINKDKNEIKNLKCPIDIENFEPDSDVILTDCLHLFHYDCIKTFIEKNKKLKELKCPLCKKVLYSTRINEITSSKNELKNSNQK